MDPISAAFAEHYGKRFAEHGATPRGVDWGPQQEDLDLRYANMLAVMPPEEWDRGVSLLDVGCGFGGLLTYAQANGYHLRYTGIDLVKEMVDEARSLNPGVSFVHADVFALDSAQRFDYVVCNGALTPRYATTIRDMDAYVHRFLRAMFAHCDRGIAANFMTTKVNYVEDHLYYINPVEMLAWCLGELSTKVRLDHAYRLYEYTMYCYRSGAIDA